MWLFPKSAISIVATLIALVADTKPNPSPTRVKPASQALPATAFSRWQPVTFERDGVLRFNPGTDFNDTRFEYRWTSESTVTGTSCTIELRLAGDAGRALTIPHIGFSVVGPARHRELETAQEVSVGGKGQHAFLSAMDCTRVGLVFWSK